MRTNTVVCRLIALAFLAGLTALVAPAQDAVHWTDVEALQNATQKVEPAFPPMARQLKVTGRVIVDLIIDSEGKVEKADASSGNPLLVNAALTAVKQWKFKSPTINGRPAKASTTLVFTFKL